VAFTFSFPLIFSPFISEHPPPLLLRFSIYGYAHTELSFSFCSASQHFDRPSRLRPLPRNALQVDRRSMTSAASLRRICLCTCVSTHLSTAHASAPSHLPSSEPDISSPIVLGSGAYSFVTYSALAHTSPFTRAISGAAPPLVGGILP
jgi:hypothetical protein